MKHYALLDGSRVVSVSQFDDDVDESHVEGLVLLQGWTGWPAGRPSARHQPHMDGGSISWVDPSSLEELKAHKRSEINEARVAADASSFSFQGKEVSADPASRLRIDAVGLEAAMTGQLPPDFPGVWKANDNTYITIPNVATWRAFFRAMVAKGAANFIRSEQLKARVESAASAQELEAIRWDE